MTRANAAANPGSARAWGVRSVPTILLFHKGKLVKRWAGQMDGEEIAHELDRLLDSSGESD